MTLRRRVIGWLWRIGLVPMAFNFDCTCGHTLITEVPGGVDEGVELDCVCGCHYKMVWKGDCFSVTKGYALQHLDPNEPKYEVPPPDWFEQLMADHNAKKAIQQPPTQHEDHCAESN